MTPVASDICFGNWAFSLPEMSDLGGAVQGRERMANELQRNTVAKLQ